MTAPAPATPLTPAERGVAPHVENGVGYGVQVTARRKDRSTTAANSSPPTSPPNWRVGSASSPTVGLNERLRELEHAA